MIKDDKAILCYGRLCLNSEPEFLSFDGTTWTYGGVEGFYVRIGGMVMITFYIYTTALSGTTSNAVTITGLPFATTSVIPGVAFGLTAGLGYAPDGAVNASTIILRRQHTGTSLVAADIPNAGIELSGSAIYWIGS